MYTKRTGKKKKRNKVKKNSVSAKNFLEMKRNFSFSGQEISKHPLLALGLKEISSNPHKTRASCLNTQHCTLPGTPILFAKYKWH